MGPAKAFTSGIQNGLNFSGRSTLSEFWWLIAALIFIEIILVAFFERSGGFQLAVVSFLGVQISLTFAITCLVLGLLFVSVAWRRLHDIGWAGWAVLVWLAIIGFFVRILMMVAQDLALCRVSETKKCFAEVGWGYGFTPAILTLVFIGGFALLMALPSQPGTNKYGPNPQGAK